jgi:hypothetical protein
MTRERGEGKFGIFMFLAVLGIIVFASIRYIPPRVNAYEFKEFVERTAIQSPYEQKATPESIRATLLDKAQDLKLPIKEDDIEVAKKGDYCAIKVIVKVPIDFIVFKYELVVDCSSSSKAVA